MAHLIDVVWTLQLFALTVTHSKERHYAETCAKRFLDVTIEWNIQEKVTIVSTDSACNVIAVASRLTFEHMTCISHSLQQSITVALSSSKAQSISADR